LFGRFSSIATPSTVTKIASLLGISDQAASRGLALSTAATFAGLARKADDSDTLRQVIDVASITRGDAVAALSAGQLTDNSSPLLSDGRRLLASVFGDDQRPILKAISRESGLTLAAAMALLPLGAQFLLNFFGAQIRDEGMTPGTLAGFLKREAPEIRSALPMALNEAITQTGPATERTIEIDPVVAQTVGRSHRSMVPWLMASAAALLGVFWLSSRPDRTAVTTTQTAVGTSGYVLPADTVISSNTVVRPDDVVTPNAVGTAGTTITLDSDRLLFSTGSATLRPQSMDQVREAAALLKANPGVNVTINGYTDNVGDPEANRKLSQNRATSVMKALEGMGVAPNRLEATGYGEEQPVADNSTEAGRALNRRITMQQK
jgi:outer membrane protein OmpA-like peptidoglycan-associated protein